MGHERKRGKLADLNLLLRGEGDDRFSLDRRRRRDARGRPLRHHAGHRHATAAGHRAPARRRDGAPAQPPAFDDASGAWSRRLRHPAAAHGGQPAGRQSVAYAAVALAASRASIRIRAPCPTSTRTCSAKARSSARASTTWMRSSARCKERFPENCILSHDLLEGCYARSGLLSDVLLYEDYPSRLRQPMSAGTALDPRRLADRAAG